MSDEEKLAEAPADEGVNLDAVEVKEEPKAEVESEQGEQAGETAGDEQPKKLSGAARAKLREARLLSENSELQRKIEELSRKTQAPAAGETEEKPPREEDFNGDFFAFQRALTAFDVKNAIAPIAKKLEAREQSEISTKQTEIVRERDLAHAERVESAREIIADYDETMKAMAGVNVRNEVIDEIKSSEKSAEIAYHLAKNPNLLAAMDRMSGRELAREMGRLEATVKLPTAKRQTTAPPPLEPLKGGASGSFDPEKASMDEYVAKRKTGWKG